jgi:hypothetical protein
MALAENANYCYNCGKPVKNVKFEEFTLTSDKLVQKIKELLHEGNITRIIIKDEKGNTLLDMPATAGVVGIILAPVLAAAGAIAAVATKCTVIIEKRG